ncbi:hypothetical protein GCM10009123_11020 [Kangiella japonica]|uniref:Uncharacterized protein n=1 Tax=Kangiella japonica TaxID=647384 RepID=A0ABN0SXP7_9GAMM
MKNLSVITAIMVVIAFAIGFYVGYNKTEPNSQQNHSNDNLEKRSQPLASEAQSSQKNQNTDSIKQALT